MKDSTSTTRALVREIARACEKTGVRFVRDDGRKGAPTEVTAEEFAREFLDYFWNAPDIPFQSEPW